MTHSKHIIITILLIIISASCGLRRDKNPPSFEMGKEKGVAEVSLSDLEMMVGKKPCSSGLWSVPEVEYYMTRMMGEDKYMELLFLMQDASALKKDRVIFSIGVLPDNAVQALGIVLFDTDHNRVYAELIYPGLREIFMSTEEFSFLPSEVMARRTAFGVEHPEMIAREYPVSYSGSIPGHHCDKIKYNLHLDPINQKYLLYQGIVEGFGETIRKQSGYYTFTSVNGEEYLVTTPGNKEDPGYSFHMSGDHTLQLVNEDISEEYVTETLVLKKK